MCWGCSVSILFWQWFRHQKCLEKDFPGGPVDKNPLPMQGTPVQSSIRENSTCHGATKPMPQLLKLVHLQPVLCNKRSHCNGKPVCQNEEQTLLAATRESQLPKTKTQGSQKKKKKWRILPLAMNFDVSDTSQISRFLVINYITHSSYCTWKRNLSEDVKWLTKPLGEPDSKSGLEALQPGAMLAYPHG